MYALQNLPSVDLPPIEQLFVLLVAYIALIGPINYLVLRRLDKREWAWVTIPVLVAVFAVGSYGLGATLKGSDVIVNQISVVRAAQGTGRGIGQVYVGIYSPSRRTFDVRVPGGALLSNPTSQAQMGQTETPLDVLFGETSSRLRNFEVGFGVLRGFRAEAPADAPALESDLRLTAGKLQGTITNRSGSALHNVALLFGGGVAVLPSLEPGESRTIDLDTTGASQFGYALSERIFGSTFPRDQVQARALYTRRSVIDQLFPYGTTGGADAPLLLAWREGSVLDIELVGDRPNHVGEALFMIPLGMSLDRPPGLQRPGHAAHDRRHHGRPGLGRYRWHVPQPRDDDDRGRAGAFRRHLCRLLARDSPDAGRDAPARRHRPGARAAAFFRAARPGSTRSATRSATAPTAALSRPTAGAPSRAAVVAPRRPSDPCRTSPSRTIPSVAACCPTFQLFDRVTQRWVEFPEPEMTRSYLIANPERYVDAGGAVLFRFVNRNAGDEFGSDQTYFQLLIRVEGTIE